MGLGFSMVGRNSLQLVSCPLHLPGPIRFKYVILHSYSTIVGTVTLGICKPDYMKEKQEEMALKEFYKNITHDAKENCYMVTWPWRVLPLKLQTNYALAKGCLLSLLWRYDGELQYPTAVDKIL